MNEMDNDVPNFFGFKNFGDQRFDRMRARSDRKWYMLYPEDRFKTNWDLSIAFVLVITCSITPVTLAFYEEESIGMTIFNYGINILFAFDMVIIFLTSFYNDDFVLTDDLS